VVPKALSAFADEDEKTTIENGWEEEASTTVEQGEVAEKIRTLGLRPVTNVTGSSSGVDEPTVDDQRANAALSMITPPVVHARLIITQGNDHGQEVEIIPGKNYTIGRAIDNDVVLTDIAVSRKHFDLRFENGAWILVDRGSGNGTLVNGNIEDAPFMLANGDAIEIGNTTFRFDHPNGIPRNAFNENAKTNGYAGDPMATTTPEPGTFDLDMEEEPSTVAGKPLRSEGLSTPPMSSMTPPQLAPLPMPSRPKTIPPPAPLPRPKPSSSSMYPRGSQNPIPAQMQAPLHQPAPAMLGAPPNRMSPLPGIGAQHPTMLAPEHQALANVMPTTIPGQGPLVHPSQPNLHSLPFTYPNVNEHAQHAQMLVVGSQMPPRDPTSTAHVSPAPYNQVMQAYVATPNPTLSRRAKLLLAGAGLTVLAAIATIAIIKGVSGPSESEAATDTGSADVPTKPDIKSIVDGDKKAGPKPTKITVDTPRDAAHDKDKAAKDKADKEAARLAKDKADKEAARLAKDKADKDAQDKLARDKAAKEARDRLAKDKAAKEADRIARDKAAKEKAAKDRAARLAKDRARKQDRSREPKTTKQVATFDSSEVRTKATDFYRRKKFNDAASVLKTASSNLTGSQRTSLRTLAAQYEEFGKAYFNGMRPSAQPIEAWQSLRRALTYDKQLGGVYSSEIQATRARIAGKVAIGMISRGEHLDAVEAVRLAEATNNVTGDVTNAKKLLSMEAASLYKTASEEISSNRQAGIQKLQRIKMLVPSSNIWYGRAQKLLAKNAK